MTHDEAMALESIAREKAAGTSAYAQGVRIAESGIPVGTPEENRYVVCMLGHNGLPHDATSVAEIDAFLADQPESVNR